MPRRVSLPGAAELFRETQQANDHHPRTPTGSEERHTGADDHPPAGSAKGMAAAAGVASGRVRHDEKITVYVSRDELLALEEARLRLRAEYSMAVDRGRIVRAAMAAAMADLAENGEASEVVRRLSQS